MRVISRNGHSLRSVRSYTWLELESNGSAMRRDEMSLCAVAWAVAGLTC